MSDARAMSMHRVRVKRSRWDEILETEIGKRKLKGAEQACCRGSLSRSYGTESH